ncbi:phosphate/phosphite/phosphonate ABC transporter substrate-binding protein [Falsiroseomonas sp. HW251]|uniref:phosphate/phosphite/phosphonate ABC transporter substrate-binding protein n=1 Tax=Falsiroseomonas sp. HW251 TaxID=3390998 RepID=UPI003D31E021
MTTIRGATRRAALALLALPAAARAQSLPPPGRRPWADQLREIRVGLLGGENEADRLARFGGFQAALEAQFRVPVRIYPAGDYAGVMQAFAARQLEVSTMGPLPYARIWLDTQGNIEPLVVARDADGTVSYVAVMYVRADSPIMSLEQMRGHSLAWADPNSTSGYLVPRSELREAGIDVDRFFSRTGFAGGHEQAIVAVLAGQYDAGVTWASGVGEQSQGFTRGALRAMVEKGMLDMARLRIIWRSRPIPNGPTAVRADTPPAFRDDLRAFMLALPTQHPEVFHQIERGATAGYAPATQSMFDPVIAMARAEAAARRQR